MVDQTKALDDTEAVKELWLIMMPKVAILRWTTAVTLCRSFSIWRLGRMYEWMQRAGANRRGQRGGRIRTDGRDVGPMMARL